MHPAELSITLAPTASAEEAEQTARTIVSLWNGAFATVPIAADMALSVREVVASLTMPSTWSSRNWIAMHGGRPIALAQAWLDERDDPRGAGLTVCVLPEHRGRGVGATLTRHALAELEAEGRTLVSAWAVHTDAGERWAEGPASVGPMPFADPAARLAIATGFSLGQIARVSVWDGRGAELDRLEVLRDAAQARAGADYRVHSWQAPSPEVWLADLAVLAGRMSLDEPQGELTLVARNVDAERIRRNETRLAASGMTVRYTVIEHVPSGRLVAHNVLQLAPDRPHRRAHQEDTLVAPEHRGRRLGMLVKSAGLIDLLREAPECPGVITWNAEENWHMLEINDVIGFTPIAAEGAWQRDATATMAT